MPLSPRLYTSLDEFLVDELRKLDDDLEEPIDPAMLDDDTLASDNIADTHRPSA